MILKVIHSFADTLYETVSVSPAFAEAATRRQVYGGSGMQFPAVVIIQPVDVAPLLESFDGNRGAHDRALGYPPTTQLSPSRIIRCLFRHKFTHLFRGKFTHLGVREEERQSYYDSADFFLRKLSPCSSMRWASAVRRSMIASARVGSPRYSCHLATGS